MGNAPSREAAARVAHGERFAIWAEAKACRKARVQQWRCGKSIAGCWRPEDGARSRNPHGASDSTCRHRTRSVTTEL